MKYEIKISEGEVQLTLPRERVKDILSEASEAELRALIAIAACSDSDKAKEISGLEDEEFNSALSFLRGAKLIGKAAKTKKAPEKKEAAAKQEAAAAEIDLSHDRTLPEYSSDEIKRLTSNDRVLCSILDEAQQVFG